MIRKIISGGQTGADQGGWLAAVALGLETGGWMPLGFITEDGPRPEFAELYGAVEHPSREYPPRTLANAEDSDATVWFGSGDSRGFGCTMNAVRKAGRPSIVFSKRSADPKALREFLDLHRVEVLNVAGNRESMAPGIAVRVRDFVVSALSGIPDDEGD